MCNTPQLANLKSNLKNPSRNYWSTVIPISFSLLIFAVVHQLSLSKCPELNLPTSFSYGRLTLQGLVSSHLRQYLDSFCFIHEMWREHCCEFANLILSRFKISGRPELCYNLEKISFLALILVVTFLNLLTCYVSMYK